MLRKTKTQVPMADWEIVAETSTGDEALFEALSRAKKSKRRKRIITAGLASVCLAAILLTGIRIARKQVRSQFMPEGDEVLSAQAARGSISTVVSGSTAAGSLERMKRMRILISSFSWMKPSLSIMPS